MIDCEGAERRKK